jgi:hypothetical protein
MSNHALSMNELSLRRRSRHRALCWEGGLDEYLAMVERQPLLARNAWQRLIDMLELHGSTPPSEDGRRRWKLFDDPLGGGRDAVLGLDEGLDSLVMTIRDCASGRGPERSGVRLPPMLRDEKGTLVRLLKSGLQQYALREDGALFTFDWEVDGELVQSDACEDPLLLVPGEARSRLLESAVGGVPRGYQLRIEGELDGANRVWLETLLERYDGDWSKAVAHVRVRQVAEFDRSIDAPSASPARHGAEAPSLRGESSVTQRARDPHEEANGEKSASGQPEPHGRQYDDRAEVSRVDAVVPRVSSSPHPLFRVQTTNTDTNGYMHGADLSVILLAVVAVFAIMAIVVATRPELIWWMLDHLTE